MKSVPSEYKRRRTTKQAGMKKRCRDKNSGNMVECNDTRAAERDQTTWTVQTQPDKYGSYFNSVTFLDASVLFFGINYTV